MIFGRLDRLEVSGRGMRCFYTEIGIWYILENIRYISTRAYAHFSGVLYKIWGIHGTVEFEAPVSGHNREGEIVSATGDGRLRECVNTGVCMS